MPTVIPQPLHPAVVHLPIALIVLLPFIAVGSLWAIKRGVSATLVWGFTTGVLVLLFASAGIALLTGNAQSDRAEQVVGEAPVETHEDAAEGFLVASGVMCLVALGGLARGRTGRIARVVATVGTVGLLAAGWRVGHTGGALVYRHGPGAAFTPSGAQRANAPTPAPLRSRDEE